MAPILRRDATRTKTLDDKTLDAGRRPTGFQPFPETLDTAVCNVSAAGRHLPRTLSPAASSRALSSIWLDGSSVASRPESRPESRQLRRRRLRSQKMQA